VFHPREKSVNVEIVIKTIVKCHKTTSLALSELESENIELSDKKEKLEAEKDKMLIQIGRGTLDWIYKKEEAGDQGAVRGPETSIIRWRNQDTSLRSHILPSLLDRMKHVYILNLILSMTYNIFDL